MMTRGQDLNLRVFACGWVLGCLSKEQCSLCERTLRPRLRRRSYDRTVRLAKWERSKFLDINSLLLQLGRSLMQGKIYYCVTLVPHRFKSTQLSRVDIYSRKKEYILIQLTKLPTSRRAHYLDTRFTVPLCPFKIL